MLFGFLNRSRADEQSVTDLYAAIVAQARHPALYRDFAVPDTVEGRLEMVVLHTILLFQRLRSEGKAGQLLAQRVFDLFVVDMDGSFREMGVGDLGVPKRMKVVGRSFYGRVEVYGKALAGQDRAALADALQRNIFPDDNPDPAKTGDLAEYVLDAAIHLQTIPFETLRSGRLTFSEPAQASAGEVV